MEGRDGVRPGALRVGVERVADGGWLITATGELDRFTVGRLTEALALAAEGDHAPVVLDLSACSFVDSSGLGALVTGDASLRDSGRRMEVVAPRFLMRVLEATGLHALLSIRPSEADDTTRCSE